MGRRILCKVADHHSTIVIYTNGEWRYLKDKVVKQKYLGRWKIVVEDDVAKFYYTGYAGMEDGSLETWSTDYDPDDPIEVKLAETIVNAQADLEMEKILKG